MKSAFTMIELIFVIVLLGILTAMAIPKLNATRDDAEMTKTLAALRNGSNEIISYVLTQGRVESNLSSMSNTLSDLESSGLATMGAYKAILKSGSINNCLTLEINSTTLTTMRLVHGNPGTDSTCISLQDNVKKVNYDMDIRGMNVRF